MATSVSDATTPLYDDKAVSVFPDELKIKGFYFPFGNGYTLKTSDLTKIKIGTVPLFEKKSWGMGFSNFWWSVPNGWWREFKGDQIEVQMWEKKYKTGYGFTPTDPKLFAEAVRELQRRGLAPDLVLLDDSRAPLTAGS
uniref:Uncharacterized protein n=1 Tax=Chromera velia CCMP2878 TaxID=1169474 RepID=A0A0G4ID18_9ALVE|eukprot:Cvel_13202.t1-p1 / transcript=Cvel_13202.t1 / gene=Cvel_13202 / organism=Chromera_velia_CCMP2878 / gene_product=hypothetical protein / transcript_product=hypothetical protein / location=Cvel_scaffold893:33931-34475(+) / protein_length=138 / sequence_SO=supercontig / SO=protein_coding / is_pseudo=false